MSVKIHNKKYVEVWERTQEFHKRYKNGSIQTELKSFEDGVVIMETCVFPDVENTLRKFTGWAYEKVGSSQINRLSALENCETSAVGRALGFLDIGLNGSISTADEVLQAIHQQEYTITDEQKERYQEYLTHFIFVGRKSDTNRWWKKFQTEEQAEAGLVEMLKRMNEHDEQKAKEES